MSQGLASLDQNPRSNVHGIYWLLDGHWAVGTMGSTPCFFSPESPKLERPNTSQLPQEHQAPP